MKRIIMLTMVLVMILGSLGGCFLVVDDRDRGRGHGGGGGHDDRGGGHGGGGDGGGGRGDRH